MDTDTCITDTMVMAMVTATMERGLLLLSRPLSLKPRLSSLEVVMDMDMDTMDITMAMAMDMAIMARGLQRPRLSSSDVVTDMDMDTMDITMVMAMDITMAMDMDTMGKSKRDKRRLVGMRIPRVQ